jgi:hypothetical protein
MDELISYLEERTGLALFIMDQERCDALASIAKGRGHAQGPTAKSDFVNKLDRIREVFLGLHRDHIGVILAEAFEQAGHIVLDIHHLLWIRTRTIFWGAHAWLDVHYTLRFAPPSYYEATHPGPRLRIFPKPARRPPIESGQRPAAGAVEGTWMTKDLQDSRQ